MKYRFWAAVSFVFFALIAAMPARADGTLTLFLIDIPGQSMLSEDEPGAGLEIVRAAAKLGGFRFEERFLPWARAVSQVEKSPMGLIIPLPRTPSREDRFTWVTTLYQLYFGFGNPIGSAPVWLTGGPELPAPVVTGFQKTFEALRADGSISRILDKYGMKHLH